MDSMVGNPWFRGTECTLSIIKAILQNEWFNIVILICIEIYSKAILIYKTDMSVIELK